MSFRARGPSAHSYLTPPRFSSQDHCPRSTSGDIRISTRVGFGLAGGDTNAVLWLLSGHRRARPLSRRRDALAVSPASVLELQLLTEMGKLSLSGSVADLVSDSRLRLDPAHLVAL